MTAVKNDGLFMRVEEEDIETLKKYACYANARYGLSLSWRGAFNHLLQEARVEIASEPLVVGRQIDLLSPPP